MRNYAASIDNRMFDFKDYYTRVAEAMPDNCRIIEIGIADGASAIFLAEAILNLGKSIERFVLVDDLSYGGSDQAQTIINHIIKSGITCFEFMQKSSLDASCKFNDGYFHHAFVDASHEYQNTKADIRLWYHKMLHGYYLAGHDANMEGVRQAVNEVIPKKEFSKHILVPVEPATDGEPIIMKDDIEVWYEDWLEIFPTEKNYGVWAVKKDDNFKLL